MQRQFDLGDAARVPAASASDEQKAVAAAGKLKSDREFKNPGSLWNTWEAAWNEVYGDAGASLTAWTKADMGALNKAVIAKWKGDAASLHQFVDWSVREWAMIRLKRFDWMKRDPAPLTPSIRFLLHFTERFISAFNHREVDRSLAGLNPQERMRREMMIKQGASAEEADREVMKRRAVGMLRDEIDAGKAAARKIEREAALTLATSEARNREHMRRVQRAIQRQPAASPEPMRYLSPQELQQTLQQVENFTVQPFDERR